MPFTFSHPAIILPLTFLSKKRISVTGLIIGSLLPDFEYFIRMKIKSDYSHTIIGIIWFDLTLGIILSFLFHNIVKDKLFSNLPSFFKSRFEIYKKINWKYYFKNNWIVVIYSLLIGIISHIFWDSFTHESGFFVNKIYFLKNEIDILNYQITFIKIFQHISTIIGLIFILIAILQMEKFEIIDKEINVRYWIGFIIISLIIILIKFIFGLNIKQIGNVIVTMISSGLIALILTSILIKKNYSRSKIIFDNNKICLNL